MGFPNRFDGSQDGLGFSGIPASPAPMVRFEQVTVTAGTKTLLKEVSFELRAGGKAVLLGPSGSGKSTVLKALLGLYPVDQGCIWFEGRPLDKNTVGEIRRRAAYIGQEPVLGAETVREALLLPFRFQAHRGREPTPDDLLETLARLRLPADILDQSCNRVSGGEKQRIALTRALLLRKTLYLLDEVTSALDLESKRAVFDLFRTPELTLLSVAHDPEWIARCDVAYRVEEGRLVREERDGDA